MENTTQINLGFRNDVQAGFRLLDSANSIHRGLDFSNKYRSADLRDLEQMVIAIKDRLADILNSRATK